jgi:dipeptidyl aminopeptidase/acylaminoacyl peptidase
MQDDPTKEAQPMLRFTALAILATLVGLAGLAARAESAVTTRIVYHAKLRGNNEILVVPSGGGVPTRLTRHRASDSNPTWSADAKFIAFESNRRRQIRVRDADVYVMAADGSRVRQLTFSNAFDGASDRAISGRSTRTEATRSSSRSLRPSTAIRRGHRTARRSSSPASVTTEIARST